MSSKRLSRNAIEVLWNVRVGTIANIVLCLAAIVASAALQYPGHVDFDGIVVWYEARHAVHFSQHPLAMALLLHYLDQIVPGPGLYTILQLVVIWVSTFALLQWMRPKLVLAIAFYLFLLIYPPILAMDGRLIKDVLSAHFALLACLIVLGPPVYGLKIEYHCATAFALTALATLIRYQFGIIAVVIGAWLYWQTRSPRRVSLLMMLGCGAAVFLIVFGIVHIQIARTFKNIQPFGLAAAGVSTSETNDFERSLRKVLIYDIGGIIVRDQAAPLSVFAGQNVDVPKLRSTAIRLYSSYNVDSLWERDGVFSQLAPIAMPQVAAQWAASVMGSPWAFTQHRLKTFSRVLGFGDVYKCFPVVTGVYQIPRDLARDVGAESYRPPYSASILRNKHVPVKVLFAPVLYAAIDILLIAAFLFGFSASAESTLLAAAGLLYEATFFALPQSCGVNYSYFMILTAVFGTALAIFHHGRVGVGKPEQSIP